MKKKLKSAFILIIISLTGIIVFQLYWTFNSYRVNKEKFDGNIDLAMQRAMDDCKKDYFDSMRVVLVKHLSPPKMKIIVDTVPNANPSLTLYNIWFLSSKSQLPPSFDPKKYRDGDVVINEPSFTGRIHRPWANNKLSKSQTLAKMLRHNDSVSVASQFKNRMSKKMGANHASLSGINKKPFFNFKIKGPLMVFDQKNQSFMLWFNYFETDPFSTTETKLDFYRKKINHKASLPEVLTEMSFYEPTLLGKITTLLMSTGRGFMGIGAGSSLKNLHGDSLKRALKDRFANSGGVFGLPPNYKKADSLKLAHYLHTELQKIHIYSAFNLIFAEKSNPSQKPNIHYSETNEYIYKYHGFAGLGRIYQDLHFFARAAFRNPQYNILRSMLITLVLSALLILLTIYCFLYITRIILQQKKLADLKDDFINNMTHELKTPIATITVAIEGLQKFNALNDPEKTRRYLQTSRDELNRLNELVSKVLNIAVFENKEITLVKERINVDELLNDIITSEKAKTGKEVNITYNNRDKIETMEADRFHFRNVLVNLVDNAIKYSDEPVDIAITCYKNGGNAVFSVKDDGIGIPPGHISQVFDKFHRVPTGNIHTVKGTGLGLSYVKYIAEAHGGSVTVKSELDRGSEFIVTLPLTNG